jgi:hypothetical protein
MGSVSFGGDPESYMDPPRMTQTDSPGGVNPIAAVLNLLGITGPKSQPNATAKDGAPQPDIKPTTQSVEPAPANLPVLNEAESAFKPMQPMPSDWGQRYLDSLKPLKTIDPNTAL